MIKKLSTILLTTLPRFWAVDQRSGSWRQYICSKGINPFRTLLWHLSNEFRVWLIDKKPKTIKEAGKFADEFTVLHKYFSMQRQVSNYRSSMPVEISISETKITNNFDRNMKAFKNGTVLDNRYVSKVKRSAERVCYSCNQVDHKSTNVFLTKLLDMWYVGMSNFWPLSNQM